ncbi:hypothetical protein LCGC14_0587480 [marine sediment metagenome]|uniref:Uncharacterized protein n=1 Tax=marine sediment metagenome TaxID=412755 RepID=A0A0F9U0Q7_9ZZZZ|nr:MAG: hypothetical protein Lokiarch_18370 [Candidatus Lokiarchaeum sp. GC14_75]
MLKLEEKNRMASNSYSMNPNSSNKKKNNLVRNKLIEISDLSTGFHKIPPIIGVMICDINGNAIMVIEHNSKNINGYGSINFYLSEKNKHLVDLNLISGYFSALKSFAGEINIKNLSNIEIDGSNIKVQIYMLCANYMIIIFLNSSTELNSNTKLQVINYFEEILKKNENEFCYFNAPYSREILRVLERRGKIWLKKLNRSHIQIHRKTYLQKHSITDELLKGFDQIIQNEINEYLINVPEDLVENLSKEIHNKIQDKLFENLREKIV